MSYSRAIGILAAAGMVAILLPGSLLAAEFGLLAKLRPTDVVSTPIAVSADGSTVVGMSHTGTWFEAVRWDSAGQVESLGSGQPSEAYGVSADGSVIVGRRPVDGSTEAFRWSSTQGLIGLGDLPGGIFASGAKDVTADGRVIVGYGYAGNQAETSRWTVETGMVGLGAVPGSDFGNSAAGVSADGAVIVGNVQRLSFPSLALEAFRWTSQTGMAGLGDLSGGIAYSEASDVSADGSVIVGRSLAGPRDYRGFRWTESTGMVELPPVAGFGPTLAAIGIAGNGNVIVGVSEGGAFAWDEFHGTRRIEELLSAQGVDLNGSRLVTARAASYDGLTIVGEGRRLDGGDEAWIARLDAGTFVPEPSSLLIAALGAVAIVSFLTRQEFLQIVQIGCRQRGGERRALRTRHQVPQGD
jgi:probable HAF family extracellular repeat protein